MIRFILFVCLISVAETKNVPTADFYPAENALLALQKTLKVKEVKMSAPVEIGEKFANGKKVVVYRFSAGTEYKNLLAVFTESKGRYDMFDYLLICNDKAVIQLVKILKYRSEHGGEIASKKWLEQFKNYSGGNLYYGEDISAISGATISAMSITRDIPKVINLLKENYLTGE